MDRALLKEQEMSRAMMEDTEMKRPAPQLVVTGDAPRTGGSTAERRARLVVACACDILGIDPNSPTGEIRLPLSVEEFEQELRQRYALTHPELVFRTDSTLERARLERRGLESIPRVILRQGAPRRRQA
jgi:siroheme synthase (precorrin-2 oxidase/ferrochelatase)